LANQIEKNEQDSFIRQRVTLRATFSIGILFSLTFALVLLRLGYFWIFLFDCVAGATLLMLINTFGETLDRKLFTGCLASYRWGLNSGLLVEGEELV
jgi:hypothetical protein